MSRRRDSRSGFSLLEILVAVTILSIALVSLLGLHARNIRLAEESANLSRAATLAERVVALERARPRGLEGTEDGTFSEDEREGLTADRIYGGEESERFVWTKTREVVHESVPGLLMVTVGVGFEDEEPLVSLSFLSAPFQGFGQ